MKNYFYVGCVFLAVVMQSCSAKKESAPQPTNTNATSTKEARTTGFTWTKSTVTGNWLTSSFPDQYTGYLTGVGGAAVKTTDGGATWTTLSGLPAQDLYASYFSSSTVGFVAGNNNAAYKTTDGGATWTALTLPTLPAVNFRHIYFYNASIGFLTGGVGIVLKTIDGGITWNLSNSGIGSTHAIYSLIFFDANNGLAGSSYGRVYKTTDGGATWTGSIVHDSRANVSSLAFFNAAPGVDSVYATTSIGSAVSSDQTTYLCSGNRGLTWGKFTLPGTYQALASVKIIPGAIYIAGGNVAANTGVIYSSATGFAAEPLPASGRLTNLSLILYSPGNAVAFAGGLNNTILKGQ